MQLFELQQQLENTQEVLFYFEDGKTVAPHFHITELAWMEKSFLDCGYTLRKEGYWQLQLHLAQDYDHRLSPSQFRGIIQKGLEHWPHPKAAVTVEYQGDTIETYFLENPQGRLILQKTQTACLAPEACNLPEEKSKNTGAQCAPNSGCC